MTRHPPPPADESRRRDRQRTGPRQPRLPLEAAPVVLAPPPSEVPGAEARPPATAPRDACDVAVIGGGIGGLATACLLAKAGAAVVLFERAADLGGVCRPVVADGLRFDVGPTLLPADADGPLGRLCARLAVAAPAPCADPLVQVALPGHRFSFAAERGSWPAEVSRELPGEGEAWQAVWGELADRAAAAETLVRMLPELPPERLTDRLRAWFRLALTPRRVRAALEAPFRATLERQGVGPKAQRVLEALLWYALARDPGECSVVAAARGLAAFGGPVSAFTGATLVQALRRRLEADAGQLRLGAEVARLLLEAGRVTGVETADGEAVRARQVIAATDPVGVQALLPAGRRPRGLGEAAWAPSHVAELLLVAVPEPYVPAELGSHCLIVPDAGRPARGENVVLLRVSPLPPRDELRVMSVLRFVPVGRAGAVPDALPAALDQIVPGARDVAAYWRGLLPAELARVWGRPGPAVRYTHESREWLGRRGVPARPGLPGFWVIGDWTFPGRRLPDVAEAALRLADRVLDTL